MVLFVTNLHKDQAKQLNKSLTFFPSIEC